ncbi:AAA family ATPase [Erwinia sp. MYb375]|uniref:AAA family ATPase n=2 Tax=Erwinia TaxID=551 RepID=UPI0030A64BCD
MRIEEIKIKNLNGFNNYSISIEDNSFIIVGENGTGKSTILSMIYYLLKAEWAKLIEYDYEDINISIDGETKSFPKQDIIDYFDRKDNRRNREPSRNSLAYKLKLYIHEYIQSNFDGNFTKFKNRDVIFKIRNEFKELGNPIPPSSLVSDYINDYILDINSFSEDNLDAESDDIAKAIAFINDKVNCSLMYLPTYRRIEQDLEIIFPKSTKLSSYIEENVEADGIVQFGMKDVESLLNKAMDELSSDFRNKLRELIAQSLQDILGNRYEDFVPNEHLSSVSEKEFEEILARVDSETLSSQIKEEIRKNTKNYGRGRGEKKPDKVIFYFIGKLIELHKLQLENESNLINFIDVCNKYLVNKELYFDRVKFVISITPTKNNDDKTKTIKWETLSSGEKQIISLFSKIYLGDGNEFIMIIDEPELSLSLEWQSTFLEDVKNTGLCEGVFAVTHSPFIYNNSLKKYAKGIGTLLEDL